MRGSASATVLLAAAFAASSALAASSTLPLARIADPQVQVRGQDAVVPVGCHQAGTQPCTGKLVLRARLGGRNPVVVGRRSFSVAHGFTAGVRVRLTAAARRVIADSHGRLTVTATADTRRAAGAEVDESRQIVLRSRASTPSDNVPELTWVEMIGTPTVHFSKCGVKPMSASYSAAGTTTDRLPGTFTEQGTWTQTGGDNFDAIGPLKTTFTITSGPWLITGTRTIDVETTCGGFKDSNMRGNGTYTATLTRTDGSGSTATQKTYKDSGLAFAYEDDNGLRTAGFMTDHGGGGR